MKIYNKLVKPISEVNYLRAENAERYRVIIRYFFYEYEKIRYWLFKEDIFEMMKEHELFKDYTIEKCQSDLASLVEWGNLTAQQASFKATTLQEFQNKKFRYQLSEYTVEIERMTIRLENLEIEGASLEPTLLERIRNQIIQLESMKMKSMEEVSSWWRSLNDDFIRLNHDYQDYIRTLNSAKAEQLMKSKEFLLFKDKLTMYLRSFIKSLQQYGMMIEAYLSNVKAEDVTLLFDKIVAYELSIPRIGESVSEEEIKENCEGRWASLYHWFVGDENGNEVDRLYDITNEIIRKLTRYAMQIGELYNQGANKKEEYRHLAKIFSKCKTMDEAHCLSALVFGVDTCLHLKDLATRDTDSINSGVYEEAPTFYDMDIKIRIRKERTKRLPPEDYSLEKEMNRQEIADQLQKDSQTITELTNNSRIKFSALPLISSHVRKLLLLWLSKGLVSKNHQSRSDDGKVYHIDTTYENTYCVVKCEDGNFSMPCYEIVFMEEHHESD